MRTQTAIESNPLLRDGVHLSKLGFAAAFVSATVALGCNDDKHSRNDPNAAGGAGECEETPTSSTTVEEAGLGPTANVTVTGHILKLEQLPAPDVSRLHVPAGFAVTKVAEELGNARMLVATRDGKVYVTRREEGDVLVLTDQGDGNFSAPIRAASRPGVHGLAIFDGQAFLATPHEIFRGAVLADGTFGPLEMIIHDLPDAGQHNTRTVQIGPDGMMYISVGSTCNECNEPNQENATILRASLDGTRRAVWATGLRDTIGWGWHPQTGELWGMDHGIDWLGDSIPQEELNKIERGSRYGWPYFWGDNQVNPHIDPPGRLSKAEWQKRSVPMVLGYTAHSAPMQLSFYDGAQFPAEYRGDAFVSMHGSWNRKPASGYEVVRVHFQNGTPRSIEPFVTGFLSSDGESGRPCGNAVASDGALLFSDDRNGVLYRVAYTGAPNGLAPSVIPAGPMLEQAALGDGVPLAIARSETEAPDTLTVSSPAFAPNSSIPVEFSEYEQGVSFPLSWTAGPDGTASYLLIVEDPDAATPKPFVHSVAWNIPAPETTLREGLPEQDLLTEPEGLRQGVNSRGTVGYLGPRPPAGDPPHAYHVQVFALDRVLDVPLSGADRDQVLAAANGHVLAAGELVANFARPDTQVSRP
ncbi:MAG TPA: YbhB/YbcL family Raf kinase inhibitor-like protein [Polyangiaceae bacterium]|nr:YbhB/YbcL family Raf kinase inhibitor-like protein [Polyangiaceae bacterium]